MGKSLIEWEAIAAERAALAVDAAAAVAERADCREAARLRRKAQSARDKVARLRAGQARDLTGRARAAGIKLTGRRRAVFGVLEAAAIEGDILSTEEIFARARESDVRATLGATRRCVGALRKAGLVRRIYTAIGALAGYRLPEADILHPLPTPAELRAAMRTCKSSFDGEEDDGRAPPATVSARVLDSLFGDAG